jgi:hypothetical protein
MKQTFHLITAKRRVTGTCAKCGKKRTRTLTAEQTVNPFNKGADGNVKTREQIAREVSAEVAAKASLPFVCASCSES